MARSRHYVADLGLDALGAAVSNLPAASERWREHIAAAIDLQLEEIQELLRQVAKTAEVLDGRLERAGLLQARATLTLAAVQLSTARTRGKE